MNTQDNLLTNLIMIRSLPSQSEFKQWILWLEKHVGAQFGQDMLTAYGDGWRLVFYRAWEDNDYVSYYKLVINKANANDLLVWFLLTFSK
jgi:hypothetical protein